MAPGRELGQAPAAMTAFVDTCARHPLEAPGPDALETGAEILLAPRDALETRRALELARGRSGVHVAAVADDPDVLAALAEATLAVGLVRFSEATREAATTQVRLARELRRPVLLEADDWDAAVAVLEREGGRAGGVLVGYDADPARLRRLFARGFLVGVDAPSHPGQAAVLAAVPVDRTVLATRGDPHRLPEIAGAVAALKGLTVEDVARVTAHNAHALLGIDEDAAARIAYPIRRSLYLNVTNRCSNECVFCAKHQGYVVKGHRLALDVEPDAEAVKAAIGDPGEWEEIVFCGYGEPLLRLDLVKEVSAWLKAQGARVRVNTDGQANLVHGRNVLPELEGLVDALSISLNAPDAATYERLCRSPFGDAGFEAMCAFVQEAPRWVPQVTATAVALPGLDVQACERLATSLGVPFRRRAYQEVG